MADVPNLQMAWRAAVAAVVARDAAFAPHRRALIEIATAGDILGVALCRCPDPACRNRTAAGLSIGRVLAVMQQEWIISQGLVTTVDRIPFTLVGQLGAVLQAIGDTCGAWEMARCGCSDPQCDLSDPRNAPTPARLTALALAWQRQGGCRHVAVDDRDVTDRIQRNRGQLLEAAGRAVASVTGGEVADILYAHRTVSLLPWYRETNERIAHCLEDHWGPEVWNTLELHPFASAVWEGIAAAGLTGGDVGEFGQAATYFGYAVAAHGFAHPVATAPFLAPFAGVFDVAAVAQRIEPS